MSCPILNSVISVISLSVSSSGFFLSCNAANLLISESLDVPELLTIFIQCAIIRMSRALPSRIGLYSRWVLIAAIFIVKLQSLIPWQYHTPQEIYVNIYSK